MDLDNTQLIMLAEIRPEIELLHSQGKTTTEIKDCLIEKYGKSHWLVTNENKRSDVLLAGMFLYCMTDEEKEALKTLSQIIKP